MKEIDIDTSDIDSGWIRILEKSKSTNKIEINLQKLERGTHKEKVAVHRKTGTTWEYRRVGRKEESKKPPRLGTGKIAALPEDIKKEILDLRRINYSGADIKSQIEGMIYHDIITGDTGIIYTKTGDPVSTGRNFLEEGLIDEHGKLTITGQALTDWAKKRGVDTSHKRKTIKTAVAEATEIADKHFQEANRKLAEVQTKNKELKTDLDRERKSHMASDEIRRELGKDNLELKAKVEELEAKIKENESKVKNLKEKSGKIREKGEGMIMIE